eukprot:Blabericola_migrator_1__5723@NODE_28_length_19984_cov_212_654667_g25_i0_p7_GENE_NODE_28_length_19984_cov_212_654667_g25_i0NODE_28_length_19984_cov_212_654667_g25_i0_p7_ORF_typecomplete_len395_score19_10DMT_YdcZ/PF04657_13/1_8e11DMT_YdcZ/PF04657_13/1_3e17PgaD/PF13994_6/5_4e03PgaD/PF13994_6/7_1e02PgaD/PF13994_6/0_24DUF5336/PF17270_2/2_3e03DUF5336/PF17270_2/2_2_NODE_28_length_19984_cov_212_654667_g25_i01530616490
MDLHLDVQLASRAVSEESRSFSIGDEKGLPSTVYCYSTHDYSQHASDTIKSGIKSRDPSVFEQVLLAAYYTVPFVAGCTIPVAGALNVQARKTCGSIFFVVGVMYTFDAIICCLWNCWSQRNTEVTFASNYFALGEYVLKKPVRWFCLAGGVAGVSQHIILAIVSGAGGTSVYTLGFLLGATVSGIALDITGCCWTPKSTPGFLLYIGGLVVAIGGVLHSLPMLMNPSNDTSTGTLIGLLCISAVSGLLMCIQASCGNQLASLIGGFRRAAAWSFISGAIVMFLIGPYATSNAPIIEILKPRHWWKMSQAPLSIFNLAAVAVCQRKMPGPMVYCWFMMGQLTGATLMDHFGWIGLEVRRVNTYKLCGLATVCCGVSLVTWSKLQKAKLTRQGTQ